MIFQRDSVRFVRTINGVGRVTITRAAKNWGRRNVTVETDDRGLTRQEMFHLVGMLEQGIDATDQSLRVEE